MWPRAEVVRVEEGGKGPKTYHLIECNFHEILKEPKIFLRLFHVIEIACPAPRGNFFCEHHISKIRPPG